jgi:uncharacterized protein (TIGR03382 family)
MNRTRLLSIVPFLLAAACSSPSEPRSAEPTRDDREAVIGGKNSDASQDAVVLVFFLDQKSGMAGSCTGTLLAPNLVLTARHCVADTDESAACDDQGNPIGGSGQIYGTRVASSLMIFKGPNRPKFFDTQDPRDINPDGVGAKILDDGGTHLCNHDIGLIILKDAIKNAPIAPIRLDSGPKVGETFTAVGWGVTDTQAEPTVRQQRTGIAVEDVGPDMSQFGPIPPNEFEVGESICQGDSGGPAIAKTGAVIGVVSRGGNGQQPSQTDPSAGCIAASNLYSKTSAFKATILKAYQVAGADPWLEGGPDPRKLKPDAACTAATDCRSNLCLADPGKSANAMTCAQTCASDATCPDGQSCQSGDSGQVCRTIATDSSGGGGSTTTTSGGCSSTPKTNPSNGLIAFALTALGLVLSRRRGARGA